MVAQGCLLKIISTLRYLARQGLATRGHIESEGNFLQLLQLRSEKSPELSSRLERREKCLSHDIQNELFEIMAHFVLKIILSSVKPWIVEHRELDRKRTWASRQSGLRRK